VRAVTTAVWLRRMGWRRVYVHTIDPDYPHLETGIGSSPAPHEDLSMAPSAFADREQLLRANREYLDWEIALYDRLRGELAAPYMSD